MLQFKLHVNGFGNTKQHGREHSRMGSHILAICIKLMEDGGGQFWAWYVTSFMKVPLINKILNKSAF